MYKLFVGKIIMLLLSVIAGFSLTGIALCVALGHILDMHWDHIKQHFIAKTGYQKSTEYLVLLTAYYSNRLVLDYQKAADSLVKSTIIQDKSQIQNVKELFLYYAEEYIPANDKTARKMEALENQINEAIKSLNGMDNKYRCFRLIESIFNDQITNPTQEAIDLLKQIGNIFSVNYQREYKQQQYNYEYEEKAEQKQQSRSSKPKQEEYKSSYISPDVKNAFKILGFKAENPPTLVKLKSEYRKQVRKYHPDILKGQQATAKKLAQAEEKLVELNKSMDIAKNFLANN